MAATLTEEGRAQLPGSTRAIAWGTVLLDNSYPTGGEAIDATGDLGYDKVMFEAGGSCVLQWDKANQKVLAFWTGSTVNTALVQVPNTTDLSAVTADYIALTAAT
jgi:hypothetical protein